MATIGITDYAQKELGDVVFVELPAVGAQIEAADELGSIESVKAVSDLFAPVTGEVVEVNTAPLQESIWCGFTPVISPTARGEDGKIYNCNADVAAAKAAIALKARRLVFMSDVPGLLRDPKQPDSIIPHLQTSEVDGLKKSGVIDKGMIPKTDSAVAAIQSGVEKVSFVDGRVPHAVLLEIFTDEGVGTEIVL